MKFSMKFLVLESSSDARPTESEDFTAAEVLDNGLKEVGGGVEGRAIAGALPDAPTISDSLLSARSSGPGYGVPHWFGQCPLPPHLLQITFAERALSEEF